MMSAIAGSMKPSLPQNNSSESRQRMLPPSARSAKPLFTAVRRLWAKLGFPAAMSAVTP